MLHIKNISKQYSHNLILDDVSLTLKQGEIVGIVGKNGVGKSTLLKILAGLEKTDLGNLELDGTVAYLPQYFEFKDQSIREFLVAVDHKSLAALAKVGLTNINLDQKCELLSGGEKTRLYFASLLVKEDLPQILLLDEPTNNLDINSLEWLEKFIKDFKGIVVLTSHDRYFLDKVVTKIVELEVGKLKVFGGNYSFYKSQIKIAEQAYERAFKDQQVYVDTVKQNIATYKEIALRGEKEFTSRNPYEKKKAGKAARAARVRERKLEKLLDSTDYLDKPETRKNYGVRLFGELPKGKLVLRVSSISKSINSNQTLNNVSFEIFGNERVWLQGKNGSGKSTLLKILVGDLQADSGDITIGKDIKVGYFSQDSTLNPNSDGLSQLLNTGASETLIYKMAAHMRLRDADLKKSINSLSRGQIAKIEFLKLIVSDCQLLVLDEPTNHLEIETREDIEGALSQFGGAILVASHDRYFIDQLDVTSKISLDKN